MVSQVLAGFEFWSLPLTTSETKPLKRSKVQVFSHNHQITTLHANINTKAKSPKENIHIFLTMFRFSEGGPRYFATLQPPTPPENLVVWDILYNVFKKSLLGQSWILSLINTSIHGSKQVPETKTILTGNQILTQNNFYKKYQWNGLALAVFLNSKLQRLGMVQAAATER